MKRRALTLLMLIALIPLWAGDPDKDLKSKDWSVRCRALATLRTEWDPKIERKLKKLVKDKSPEVRLRLIELIAERKLEGYEKLLRQAAVDGETWAIRDAAAMALVATGVEGLEKKLVQQIKGDNAPVILRTVGMMKTATAVEALAGIARKKGTGVQRAHATRALGLTGHADALKVLKELIGDLDLPTRCEAYLALRHFDRETATDILVTAALGEKDDDALHRIGTALHHFGTDVKSDVISTAFTKADKDGRVRLLRVASRACWKLPLPVLKGALKADASIQAWAVHAVSCNPDDELVAELAGHQTDDVTVQRNLAQVVAAAGARKETRTITDSLLKSPSAQVRLDAVCSAGWAGDEFKDLLQDVLNDEDPVVYSAAALAAARNGVDGLPSVFLKRMDAADWRERAGTLYACAYLKDKAIMPVVARGLDDKDVMTRNLARRVAKALTGMEFKKAEKFAKWWDGKKGSYTFPETRSRLAYWQTIGGEEKAITNRLGKSEILVRNGGGDNLIAVLKALDFKCTDVSNTLLSDSELNPEMVLCITCVGALTKEEVERADWFVALGGRLFMTDEGLGREGLQPVTGYVSIGSEVTFSMRTMHPIMPRRPEHDLLRDVFVKQGDAGDSLTTPRGERRDYPGWEQWGSLMIKIEDPFRTEVLADSLDLKSRYNFSPMLTTWYHGFGRAMHAVSHFDYQMNTLKGEVDNLKGKKLLPYLVDELGFPHARARALIDGGTLKKEGMRVLYGDFALFRVMANFIEEQNAQAGNQFKRRPGGAPPRD